MREEREKKRQGLKWCAGVLTLVLTVVLVCPVQAEEVRAKVQIPVRCEAQTDSESFTYDLSGAGSVHETVETGTLILKNGEKGMFTVYYDYPDIYHYTVSQRQGAENKTIYDSTVYQVDVYVTEDADGKLHADAAAYVKGSTEKKAELDFHNRQRSSDSPSHRKHKGNTESDTEDRGYRDACYVHGTGSALGGRYHPDPAYTEERGRRRCVIRSENCSASV